MDAHIRKCFLHDALIWLYHTLLSVISYNDTVSSLNSGPFGEPQQVRYRLAHFASRSLNNRQVRSSMNPDQDRDLVWSFTFTPTGNCPNRRKNISVDSMIRTVHPVLVAHKYFMKGICQVKYTTHGQICYSVNPLFREFTVSRNRCGR